MTADALEPNVFYQPMLAVPAVERFTAGKHRAFRTLRHASRLLGGWREHGGRSYQ